MKNHMLLASLAVLAFMGAAPTAAAEAEMTCVFGPYYQPNPNDDSVQQRDGVCPVGNVGGNVAVVCIVQQQEIMADYVQGSTESGFCVGRVGLDGATCVGYSYSSTDYNGDTSFSDYCALDNITAAAAVGTSASTTEDEVLRGACLAVAQTISNEVLEDACLDVFGDLKPACAKYLFHNKYVMEACQQVL